MYSILRRWPNAHELAGACATEGEADGDAILDGEDALAERLDG
jgi:hypothetical protein